MSLTCPYCKKWMADCEDLPKEQEEIRAVKCPKCEKVYGISWEITHTAFTAEEVVAGWSEPHDWAEQVKEAMEE